MAALVAALFAILLGAVWGLYAVSYEAVLLLFTEEGEFTHWGVGLGYALLTFVISTGLVWLWWRYGERRTSASVGLPRSPIGAAEVAWAGAGFAWAIVAVAATTLDDPGLLGGAANVLAGEPVAAALAVLVITPLVLLAASAEEIVFRGWALTAVAARAGLVPAVVITSLLFAAVHIYPGEWSEAGKGISFIAYAVVGATFAAIALRQRRLYGAIAFHSGFNIAWLLLSFGAAGLEPKTVVDMVVTGGRGEDSVQGATLWLALELGLLLFLIRWRKEAGPLRPAASPA